MLIVGDPVDWLIPMPMTLVLWVLIFGLWMKFRPGPHRWRRRLLTVLVLWFVVVSTPVIINLGVKAMEGPAMTVAQQLAQLPFRRDGREASASPEADFVIVPSAGSPGRNSPVAELSLGGYQRLMAGIETWRHVGGELVLMGGMAKDPENSLAVDMRRIAIAMGVPAKRISIVTGSSSTWEDVSGAAQVMAAQFPDSGIRMDRAETVDVQIGDPARPVIKDRKPRVVLVTSAMHMKRTMMTVNHLGIEAIPLRSDYRQISAPGWRAWFPNNGGAWGTRSLLHEFIGIHAYQLSGKG